MVALEATDRGGSLALAEEGLILDLEYTRSSRTHSARIMPLLDRMLEEHSRDYEAIDRVAVARGPGSFTATRLAVTTAKTLTAACEASLFAVTTLRIMAEYGWGQDRVLWSAIDARRGELYVQRFRWHSDGIRSSDDPRVISPDRFRTLCGDEEALILYRDRGQDPDWSQWPASTRVFAGETLRPLAAPLVELAHREIDQGNVEHDPDQLTPCYVRPSDARRQAAGEESRS